MGVIIYIIGLLATIFVTARLANEKRDAWICIFCGVIFPAFWILALFFSIVEVGQKNKGGTSDERKTEKETI